MGAEVEFYSGSSDRAGASGLARPGAYLISFFLSFLLAKPSSRKTQQLLNSGILCTGWHR